MLAQSHGGSRSQPRSVIDGLDADACSTLALSHEFGVVKFVWQQADLIRKTGRRPLDKTLNLTDTPLTLL